MKIATVFISLLFVSCFHLKEGNNEWLKNQHDLMRNCKENWLYEDLKDSFKIKVLLVDKEMRHGPKYFPNFIIGITKENDTIGVLYKSFNEIIQEGEIVSIFPSNWNSDEKLEFIHMIRVSDKQKRNSLYCSIVNVYWVKL